MVVSLCLLYVAVRCGVVCDKAVMVVALQLGAIFELVGTRWPQGLFIPLPLFTTHIHTSVYRRCSWCTC
jgi:hypothetical protein